MKRSFWSVALPVGAIVFLLVVMTGTLVTFILPKYYRSEAGARLTFISAPVGNPLQTEFEVIKSDIVLLPVVEKHNLRKHWGDRFSNGQNLETPLCLSLLRSRLDLRPVRGTDFIRIGVFADVPREAAEQANTVASAYADYCATNAGSVRVEIVNKAEVPLQPVSPKVALNILLSVILGALIGAVVGGGCGWLLCRESKGASSAPAAPPPIPRS